MADHDLTEALSRALAARVAEQRQRMLRAAQVLDAEVTLDRLLDPGGCAPLRADPAFRYEEGLLSGLVAAQQVVAGREVGPACSGDAAAGPSRDPHVHDDGYIPYRHCPRCGAAFVMRRHVPHDPPRLTCPRCTFVFYLDPKVAAGVIVETTGRGIVLGRRAIEPRVGFWGFPSGYVDRGEPVEDAALREVREEVGLEAEIDRLVGVYSYPRRPVVVVVFAGRATGGALTAGHETSEARIFAPADIPWDDLAFPSTRDSLRDHLAQ